MRAAPPVLLRLFLLAAAIPSPVLLHAAGDPAAPAEPPLELPKFVVTDQKPLPPPESWRYARIPGLEILSGVPDRETQKLLRDFQLFRDAIGVVWPGLQVSRPVPMTLILVGPGKNFAAFLPADPAKSGITAASVLLQDPEQAAIVLNSGTKTLTLKPADADQGMAITDTTGGPGGAGGIDGTDVNSEVTVDYYRQLYREYVLYQLSFSQPRLPVWLEEGLTQLLMGMRVEPKFIEFAKLEDPNLAAAGSKVSAEADPDIPPTPGATRQEERDFNSDLARKGLIPLDQFFAVGRDSPEALSPVAGKWAKQAAALVHMWLYGEGRKYNRPFAEFVARATREPVTEEMFQACFKMGYTQMLTALRLYISNTAYQYKQFNADKKGAGLPEPAPLELREATPAEIGRLKGEAEALAGHIEPAHDEMLAPYARGLMDGPLLASLGLVEKTRGETTRARKFLEAAAKMNVVRPRAYLELANLRFAEIQRAPAGAEPAPLTADQTKTVLQPLLVARSQPPPLPEVYELMADVWLHSSATPGKADLAAINQGVLLFQRRPQLLLNAAVLNGRYGDPAEARTMAEFGVKLSRTPEARQAFADVLASLPPAPAKK